MEVNEPRRVNIRVPLTCVAELLYLRAMSDAPYPHDDVRSSEMVDGIRPARTHRRSKTSRELFN